VIGKMELLRSLNKLKRKPGRAREASGAQL